MRNVCRVDFHRNGAMSTVYAHSHHSFSRLGNDMFSSTLPEVVGFSVIYVR